MGTFRQAVEWMKEGKKVKQKWYALGDYNYQGDNGQSFYWDSKEGRGSWAEFLLKDFEAVDWEIYCEEHDWVEEEWNGNYAIPSYCKNCGIEKPEEKSAIQLRIDEISDVIKQLDSDHGSFAVNEAIKKARGIK